MSDSFPNPTSGRPKGMSGRALGLVVGALTCSVARFAVTAAYSYYLFNWGGPWFTNQNTLQPSQGQFGVILFFAFVSAALGLVVGGVSGATCKPVWGTFLGAMLSAGFCFGCAIMPSEFALGWSGKDGLKLERLHVIETLQIFLGIIPMTLAGAIGGGVGAFVGRRRLQKQVDQR